MSGPAWMPDGKAPSIHERAPIRNNELLALLQCNAEMLAALKEVSRTITLEHHLKPDYGWKEWLEETVLPAIAKAEGA